MNKNISGIIKYLIDTHYVDNRLERNCLSLEVDDDNTRFGDGNVRINAYGKWVKDFRVRPFAGEVWPVSRNPRTNIIIRVGDEEFDQYEIYKVNAGKNIILELEQEPYVKDCEYYVSFVFKVPQRTLMNKFPVIKKYIKAVADEHKALKIKITGSNAFWKAADKVEKCIKLVGECISTIITYETTNNCRELLHHSLDAATNDEAVEKFQELLSQRILDYNDDDLKL